MSSRNPHSTNRISGELGSHYIAGNPFFVFRKPFLINESVKSRKENELDKSKLSDVENKLRSRRIADDEVYLGVAGLKSLDIVSIAGLGKGHSFQQIILYDVNQGQISAMQEVINLIKGCPTPELFKERFVPLYMRYQERPEKKLGISKTSDEYKEYFNVFGANKKKYQPQTKVELETYLEKTPGNAGELSWLSKKNYTAIRELAKAGKIQLFNFDLRDRDRVNQLRGWLDERKLRVGAMYISSMMDFMDPYLSTDYYSKSSGLKQAQDFYTDLFSLVHDDGQFIVSSPDPEHPISQDYFLNVMTKQQMRDVKDGLPNAEPDPIEKSHDYMFNTNALEPNEQVWRIKSYGDDKRDENKSRYFRISSEFLSHDVAELRRQIATINAVLKDVNGELKNRSLPEITLLDPKKGEDKKFGIDHTVESRHFDMEAEFADRAVRLPSLQGHRIIHLASHPFIINAVHGQDPADSLKVIQEWIVKALDKHKTTSTQAEAKEPPEIVILPTGVKRLLERAGAAPPIETIRNAGPGGRSGNNPPLP
ncbi:MAG: hypothetical protein LW823_00925 [Rickettsiales bacterium]|jgi:hypothetical protein|nr:hypothetical protein [Rickettsiales bacterium]